MQLPIGVASTCTVEDPLLDDTMSKLLSPRLQCLFAKGAAEFNVLMPRFGSAMGLNRLKAIRALREVHTEAA